MGKFIDLTGQVFGRLTVVERVENTKSGTPRWACLCECGNKSIVQGRHLKSGATKSCGCWNSEAATKVHTTHGKSGTRLHNIWSTMRQRCRDPKTIGWSRYGGRGIKVCDEWQQSFEYFSAWATANGYTDELTIDRFNNDGNYEPGNCRWVTRKVQNNNRRDNVQICGKTLAEWCDEKGGSSSLMNSRLKKHGWTIARALTTPLRGK